MQTPQIDETAVLFCEAIIGDVHIGPRSSIWYNCVLRGDTAPIHIGAGTNVQDGCILHADPGGQTRVGDDVTVGHGCILHGCTVEDGVLVGMGSVVMNGAVLQTGCAVGAGSLVTENSVIPAGMLAFGRPAKVVRPLSDVERANQTEHARQYARQAAAQKQS